MRSLVLLGMGFLALACDGGSDEGTLALGDGSVSATTVACRQKDDADGDEDCVGHGSKRRKLDCQEAQVAEALDAGCERTEPGQSDVCCPASVSGTPDA